MTCHQTLTLWDEGQGEGVSYAGKPNRAAVSSRPLVLRQSLNPAPTVPLTIRNLGPYLENGALSAPFPDYGYEFLTGSHNPVIPAKAGIHAGWIPAFAGMTSEMSIGRSRYMQNLRPHLGNSALSNFMKRRIVGILKKAGKLSGVELFPEP
jgi:hypothetical protein